MMNENSICFAMDTKERKEMKKKCLGKVKTG